MSKLLFKKPYIETILGYCLEEDLAELKTIIDSELPEEVPVVVMHSSKHTLQRPEDTEENQHVFVRRIDFGDGVLQTGIVIFLNDEVAYFLRPDRVTSGPITVFTFSVEDEILTSFVKSSSLVDVEELRRCLTSSSGGGSTLPDWLVVEEIVVR